MRPAAVIFALGLAVSGTFGCASLTLLPLRGSDGESQPLHITPAGPVSLAPATSTGAAAAGAALPDAKQQAQVTIASPALREETSPLQGSEKKPDKPGAQAKPARVEESSPTNLQKARGPVADDRLLDLVEKDLDRAVEQPAPSRRLEFSKAVVENPKVRYFVNYFSRSGKNEFEKILARGGKYLPMISAVLREEGLPDELAYLALIESGFAVGATSIHGAAGLWQFVPMTARKYGLRIDGWIDERRDPVKSTRAAAAYLKDLHDYFGRWYLATAAYNAGLGAVDRAFQNSRSREFSSLADNAKLREETRNFVPKFVAATLIATNPQQYGFGSIPYESPLEYEEIEIAAPVKLEALAAMAGTELSTLRELNPSLLRSSIPPGEKSFRVKIPTGAVAAFTKAAERQKEVRTDSAHVVTHEVKKGETLFSIAKRYGQGVRALMEFNGLSDSRLRIGQKLQILLQGLRGTLR